MEINKKYLHDIFAFTSNSPQARVTRLTRALHSTKVINYLHTTCNIYIWNKGEWFYLAKTKVSVRVSAEEYSPLPLPFNLFPSVLVFLFVGFFFTYSLLSSAFLFCSFSLLFLLCLLSCFPPSFGLFSSAFYKLLCCLSSHDHDKAWGHCVSVGLRHRQSHPCWTPFYKHEGVRNLSLSPRGCNLHKDKICKMSSGWTGMLVFQHFHSFFVGGLSASEEEEEKHRMLETMRFGLEMTIS